MAAANFIIMQKAKEALSGNWGLAIGTTCVLGLIEGIICAVPILGIIAMIFIAAPFLLGYTFFCLSISRRQDPRLEQIFDGFKYLGKAFITALLAQILIFLWTLCLIIPGIIAAFSYSQIFYIIVDDPDIKPMDALRKSKAMMDGHKFQLFLLHLRFAGWFFLSAFTLFIGLFWLIPWFYVSLAKFYDEINPDKVVNPESEIIDHLI